MSILTYVGLGSNLGDREANLRAAVEAINRLQECTSGRLSSLYECEPWGREDQPAFLNAVLEMRTALPPAPLFAELQRIERELGRTPGPRWGARVIDLDLLLYGELVVHEPDLEIPHPRLHERRFVLVPLSELNPDMVPPLSACTVAELCALVPDSLAVRKLEP